MGRPGIVLCRFRSGYLWNSGNWIWTYWLLAWTVMLWSMILSLPVPIYFGPSLSYSRRMLVLEVGAKEGLTRENGTPPDSLTGVQTAGEDGSALVTCGIDWISWTWKEIQRPDAMCQLVGIPVSEWVSGSGANNYRDGLRSGNYTVLYNGTQEGMGVHLRCSGEACRDWAGREGFLWPDMLRYLVERGSFSRVDVAFDVRGGRFPIDGFFGDLRSGNLTTRWKEWTVQQAYGFAGDTVSSTGSIARFGSRSSSSYLRVYDKGAQMGGAAGQWIRVELETKGDRTAPLLDKMLREGIPSVATVLNGLLTIREPAEGPRYRRPIAGYWKEFIGSAERCRLTVDRPVRSAGDVAAWVEKSVGPSLAMLYRHYNYGPEFVAKVAEDAQRRMSKRHWEMVQEVN